MYVAFDRYRKLIDYLSKIGKLIRRKFKRMEVTGFYGYNGVHKVNIKKNVIPKKNTYFIFWLRSRIRNFTIF
jgi:hypothetical protein